MSSTVVSTTWFTTGANRGFGYEIARAAVESGDSVAATARDRGQARAAQRGYGVTPTYTSVRPPA